LRHHDRGLTLLEVLVATALLAVFFASVYSLVAGTIEIRKAIEDDATPYAVGPVVMDRVIEDLRGALVEPYKGSDVFKAEKESVNGEQSTKLDFVTCVPSRSRVKVQSEWVKARINEVGYRLRKSESGQNDLNALYRREDLGVDEEPLAGGKYYKLADRVKRFEIDWFAEDPGDPAAEDDAKGEPDWDAKTEVSAKKNPLPWGCRITLELRGESTTDERGRDADEGQPYLFVTTFVFPSRYDKSDAK
jgi:prepilin-type N-terminal cleavage/methylation domain-containing protein